MSKSVVGAILTGGKSSRMNYINKSFLNINNKDFIEIIINTLSKRLEKIYINANQINILMKSYFIIIYFYS